MYLNKGTLALWCVTVGSVTAFSPAASTTRVAFVGRTSGSVTTQQPHTAGCPCAACTAVHSAGCVCPSCTTRRGTALFADVVEETETTEEEVPEEVLALDGVDSEDEAHNMERPARQQLKKKKKGQELSELEVGSTVPGTIKSITTYGAFVDIGATTDGLLHISQLSTEFVGDVSDVVKEGQEVEVRIVNVDIKKGQVGLSLITEEQASAAQQAAQDARDARQAARATQNQRRDDSQVLSDLKAKGWDSSVMVEGTVVSTVDFGCFVRIDASKLNSECEGEFDGLVHISALRSGRVGSVTDVVKVDQPVQVRVKSIDGNKVSLTMLSVDDESSKAASNSSDEGPGEGAKDWKEQYDKVEEEMPVFHNYAVIEDRRK